MNVDVIQQLQADLRALGNRLALIEGHPAIAEFLDGVRGDYEAIHAAGNAANNQEIWDEERRQRAAGIAPRITLPGEISPGVDNPGRDEADTTGAVQDKAPANEAPSRTIGGLEAGQQAGAGPLGQHMGSMQQQPRRTPPPYDPSA